jgi:hypothetical protein
LAEYHFLLSDSVCAEEREREIVKEREKETDRENTPWREVLITV